MYGFEVSKATNGEEAVEMVRNRIIVGSAPMYNLIVLDINMPVLNGLEACSSIKKLLELES